MDYYQVIVDLKCETYSIRYILQTLFCQNYMGLIEINSFDFIEKLSKKYNSDKNI